MNKKRIFLLFCIVFFGIFIIYSVYNNVLQNGKAEGFREGVAFQKCIDEDMGIKCTKENYEKYYLPKESNILTYMFPITIELNSTLMKEYISNEPSTFIPGTILTLESEIFNQSPKFMYNDETELKYKILYYDGENITIGLSVHVMPPNFIYLYYGEFNETNNETYNNVTVGWYPASKFKIPITFSWPNMTSKEIIDNDYDYWIENYETKEGWVKTSERIETFKVYVVDIENLNQSILNDNNTLIYFDSERYEHVME